MEKQQILDALKKARESKKRNFEQSIDVSIVLKEFDMKKPDNKVDEVMALPAPAGKKVKICGLVDKELTTQSRESFDKTISKDEFADWNGKKRELKKLGRDYDYFVAQATIMTDIASTFGKIFGPIGKMPNPKAGCIVPPKVDLKVVRAKLDKQVKVQTKKQPVISVLVGKESSKDEDIAKNIEAVYNFTLNKLPRKEQQIKRVYIKTTMGEPVPIGA